MQFIERISGIKDNDRVLEIGPGGQPHPRADVYLELAASEPELKAQRGHVDKPALNGKVVYYEGRRFPFKDQEFDYVICSHVIEHVANLEYFSQEMFRVGKRGYIEYPTVYYEYLYNFSVHLNFVKTDQDAKIIYFIPKSDTPFEYFRPVHELLYDSLSKGYDTLVGDLRQIMFEGFEWQHPYQVRRVKDISLLTIPRSQIPPKQVQQPSSRIHTILKLFKRSYKPRNHD